MHCELALSVDAPGQARRAIEALDGALTPDMLERARLLVSELVTNSCRHGEGPIELVASSSGEDLELFVRDTGPGFDPPADLSDPAALGGRGLLLVELLASEWSTGGSGAPWIWLHLMPQLAPAAAEVPAAVSALLDIRRMLDSVKDYAICTLDRGGRLTTWPAGAERLTGFGLGDVIGSSFASLYAGGGELDLARSLATAANEGRAEDERLYVRKDGSVFRGNTVVTPIYDSDHAVRAFTTVTRDVSSRHRLDEHRTMLMGQLQEQALTDELTGLPNRRWWHEELDRELARARRDRSPLCVGMVDLDGFKAFNDAHGHQAGDVLLCRTAEVWAEALRATDILARYGGDEFLLLLPACPLPEAHDVVDRLRDATPDELTCSVGLTCSAGDEGTETVVARADAALYEAKRRGRDSVVVAANS